MNKEYELIKHLIAVMCNEENIADVQDRISTFLRRYNQDSDGVKQYFDLSALWNRQRALINYPRYKNLLAEVI